MLVQVSEEHHCYICGYVDTFITFSFILYFEIYVMTFDQRFFYSPVAPVCYAHLAAAQMSQFMKFEEFADASSGSGVPSSTATVPELPRLHTDRPLPLDPPFPLPLSARPRGEFTGGGGRDEIVPESPDPLLLLRLALPSQVTPTASSRVERSKRSRVDKFGEWRKIPD